MCPPQRRSTRAAIRAGTGVLFGALVGFPRGSTTTAPLTAAGVPPMCRHRRGPRRSAGTHSAGDLENASFHRDQSPRMPAGRDRGCRLRQDEHWLGRQRRRGGGHHPQARHRFRPRSGNARPRCDHPSASPVSLVTLANQAADNHGRHRCPYLPANEPRTRLTSSCAPMGSLCHRRRPAGEACHEVPGDRNTTRPQRTVIDGIRRAAEAGSPSAAARSSRPGSFAPSTARGSSVFLGRPSRATAGT